MKKVLLMSLVGIFVSVFFANAQFSASVLEVQTDEDNRPVRIITKTQSGEAEVVSEISEIPDTEVETNEMLQDSLDSDTTASDVFLKIDSIQGESDDNSGTDDDKTDEVVLPLQAPQERSGGFYKIGDIEGESTNDSMPEVDDEVLVDFDNGSDTLEMNKAEHVDSIATDSGTKKKPKEIVVVGSRVRGWDPVKKEEVLGMAKTADQVIDEESLQSFASNIAAEDKRVKKIILAEDAVEVRYKQPALFLGFIPSGLTETATVKFGEGAHGALVKVKFPWYRFLFRKPFITDFSLEDVKSDENTVLKGAKILQNVYDVIKVKHDTAKSSINNVR